MATIVIVATRYDPNTRVTHGWATALETTLVGAGHTVTTIYRHNVSPAALSAALPADLFVFYGHGEPDRLIGQQAWGAWSAPSLVDSPSVRLLSGSPVYAVCCHALRGLGAAYAYAFPHGVFVGYDLSLGFSPYHPGEFGKVVNDGAAALLQGTPPQQLVNNLRRDWMALSDAFLDPIGGRLYRTPDFSFAGFAAAGNAGFVGVKP